VIRETLVLAALAYFIHYLRQEKKINALKQAKLEMDLNYLKAQLQPHFFFNTLNNIYSLAQASSAETAPMIEKLSGMMRYIIYETSHSKVLLQKEISFLQNYIDVESVRYGNRISIRFDSQVMNKDALIEPLLLLPFIENTFKHGAQQETGKGFIEIVICLDGAELILETKNSKPVLPNVQNGPSGIGLKNVKERLELLYPDKHKLVINDEEKVYALFLSIQLNE
jgi:LytS/YehU family sensor histidine kinase